ncbi:MAG: hypothetical protein WC621_05640, partial [Patescibacteria group bacterium]
PQPLPAANQPVAEEAGLVPARPAEGEAPPNGGPREADTAPPAETPVVGTEPSTTTGQAPTSPSAPVTSTPVTSTPSTPEAVPATPAPEPTITPTPVP